VQIDRSRDYHRALIFDFDFFQAGYDHFKEKVKEGKGSQWINPIRQASDEIEIELEEAKW